MESTLHKRCIIVGAGIAGISAALHLAQNGVEPIVLESRPYIGGRARSFIDEETSELIDNGQHLLMGCYSHTLRVVRLLETEQLLHTQTKLDVQFRSPNSPAARFAARYFSGQLGAAEALLRLDGVRFSSKLRALHIMTAIQLGARATADETAMEFLQRYRQGADMIQRFWEPLIVATLNAIPVQVSAALLVEVLRRSILAGGNNGSLMIAQSGLGELLSPFADKLHSLGGQLHLRTEVSELVYSNHAFVGVGTHDEREFRGDALILATPPRALEKLGISIPLHYSPIVSVYLWFDRDFVPDDFCALLGTTTQWVFNRRRLCTASDEQRKRYPGHLTLTVSAAGHLAERSAESIVELCLDELRSVFAEAKQATLLHSKVIKERFATLVCSPEAEARRPSTKTSIPNQFLAGDWTNTGLPATLEGAAQSGIDAARAVLMCLK